MTLKQTLLDDIKDAMRAKEAHKLTTLRMLTAAMKQREVDERIELSDADIVTLTQKLIKQRRESIAAFEQGGRAELALAEATEIGFLEKYLPQQLSAVELDAMIAQAMSTAGVAAGAGAPGMGRVMAVLKPLLAGRADMQSVSALLKQKLA